MGMVLSLKKKRPFCWIPKDKQGTAGFLLVEAVLGSLLLMTIVTGFFLITSHSVKWIHMLHHRHELLLDARFSRIQVMNRIRYSPVVPTLHNHGLEVRSPYHWRLGLYKYSLVTILSNGQKQDITESEISPEVASIWVYPLDNVVFQQEKSGVITMQWYSQIQPYWERLHVHFIEGGNHRYIVTTGVLPYAIYLEKLYKKDDA